MKKRNLTTIVLQQNIKITEAILHNQPYSCSLRAEKHNISRKAQRHQILNASVIQSDLYLRKNILTGASCSKISWIIYSVPGGRAAARG